MSNKPFGVIFMIDADECEGNITSKDHIQSFIDKFVRINGNEEKGRYHF